MSHEVSLRRNHRHRRGSPCDEHLRTIILDAEDVSLAEVHVRTGFYDTSNRTEPLAPSLAEVRALELSGDGVLVRGNQREARKAGGNIGNGGRDSTVHQPELLLMLGAKFDLGHNMARLYMREHTADVLHELLTLKVAQDGLTEMRVFGGEFHAAKLARWNVNFT